MPNRTAKFLSTIVAGCLAGAALTGVSHGQTPAPAPTPAADECLAGPKGQAPSGSHWYYRIERGTKRHCWYLGPQRDARAQAAPASQAAPANQATPANTASTAPAKAAPSATPASPKPDAAMSGTVVNARAELTASQARGAQEANAAGQVSSAAAAGTPSVDNGAGANGNPDAQQSPIAARWPDQLAANEPDAAEPATNNSAADAQTQLAVPPPPTTPVAAAPAASAPAATTPLATADASSEKESSSIQTLLIVIAGALAGLAGSAIVRFGSRWRRDNEEIENDRSAMWDAVRADHQSRPIFQEPAGVKLAPLYPGELRAAGSPRSVSAARAAGAFRPANAPRPANIPRLASAPRAVSNSDDNITEMLARLARSAQS